VCAYDKTHSRQGWNEVWVDVAGIEGHVRARYSGAYASKSAAMWLYPQTGDEVLLCTMAGDPCSLVMIGAMNNPVNKLPEGWTVIDNDKRGLVFHKGEASLGLKFDQKAQHMAWGGGAGSNLQQITVDAKTGVAFDVKAGEFSVTTAKGGISLSAKEKDVQVRAKSHLTLGGDQGVAVSSDRGAVKLSGKTTMALSAKDVALAAGQSKVDLTQVSISMKATSVTVKGVEGMSLNGGATSELSLKSVSAVLKGPSVEIDGQAKADVKSPMISLKP
jgi:phage baseplate assembly protein gpV